MAAKKQVKKIEGSAVQRLNVSVPRDVAIAVRVRCANSGQRISDAATEALRDWARAPKR